jgi:translation initiation factor 2B subunit (eIF-2B alpha/beta/delta family)
MLHTGINLNTKVIEKINKLKSDRAHGAGWLSRQAISILNLALDKSQAHTITEFIEEIQMVASELINARPTITPIANYIGQFLQQIIQGSQSENDLASLRSFAKAKGNELIKSSVSAVSKAVEYGCGIITDLDTVITCSYSSTICKVLELSRQRETRLRVIVAESRFEDTAYGEITAGQLMKHQIPAEIIRDEDIEFRISKADKALVGADSITADGYLINGTPTFTLAEAAKRKKIPFYTICETAKFDIDGGTNKVTELESGFEKTPLDLITGIITEKGTMQPSLVIAYIEETRQLSP